MSGLSTRQLAKICRDAVDQELYGGRAPSSSNVLTEVWPTRKGHAFLIADEEFTVVVARTEDLPADLVEAHYR